MAADICYTISFNHPKNHYCEVKITVKNFQADALLFSMPVWTPGSYLVREYSGKVEAVTAVNGKGVKKEVIKVSKNTWSVDAENSSEINFSYKVYCNESSVRTSEVNDEHAFINPTGTFMFVRGFENNPCVLCVELPKGWKKISTGLTSSGKNKFTAENYDVLADSPIEIGNQNILEFSIKGVDHRICIAGKGNYDPQRLVKDFKLIAETQIKFFGGKIPYKDYTYIINLVEKGGGGLEHLNSFAVQFPRLNFTDEKLYKKFLGLVSHEYFHLWNVKRIRPIALGPFDYDRENYTRSLWVSEGWTSYYDNVFLRRAGLVDNEEYLEMLERELNDVMRYQGRFNQSLRDSSYDTWIKFYRKDENSNNSQVSYYTKGALAALMLNIEIMTATNLSKSLDDVLLKLYGDFQNDPSRGFTEESLKKTCEDIAGKNLDEFWRKYLDGTDELPIREYFARCGIEMININHDVSCSLDIEPKYENGKLTAAKVFAGGSAYAWGISAGDEIIAIDGFRVDPDLMNKILAEKKTGDSVNVIVSRKGLIKEIEVRLMKPLPNYKLSMKKKMGVRERKLFRKWILG